MDKNTSLAFVLIGLVLIAYFYFMSPEQQPIPANKKATTSQVQKQTAEAQAAAQDSTNPARKAGTQDSTKQTGPFTAEGRPEKIITVENDLVRLELTSKGGRIRRLFLKQYNTWNYRKLPENPAFERSHVQLINSKEGGDFNMMFVSKDGKMINTSALDFQCDTSKSFYRISGNQSLKFIFTYRTDGNRCIQKTFNFRGDNYASDVDLELFNMKGYISSYRYDVIWATGINFVEENSVDEGTHATATAFSGGEDVTLKAEKEGVKVNKEINGQVDWVGVRNKYFTVIMAPDKPNPEGGAYMEGIFRKTSQLGDRKNYSISLKVPFKDTDYQKNSFKLYAGPIDYSALKSYNRQFEALYDFGSFFGLTFVIRPISEYILLPLFKVLHSFIPNYGWVIIFFALILKIALYPFTKQSYKSMKKMQLLQPKIKELKDKYKDDQARIQKETMALYSTYGINPMGGCLPMLLQMPILMAMWSLFNIVIELRHANFAFWITNLSSPDVIYTLPFKIPFFNIDQISGLALLLGITMYFQQKMSTQDPSQKAMVYTMPVVFTLMFMSFPSGLNLYYLMFNLFTIAQQYYINHKKGDSELVPVKNPKKKGFMSRMMENAEKQKQLQQKTQAKRKR